MELLISKNIARYRREKNITQDELAASLDVTPQAVSNWERGGYPDITLLPGIANFFGVTIDELMGNDEIGKEADKEIFRKKFYEFKKTEDRVKLALSYYRKYPTDEYYIHYAAAWCTNLVAQQPEKRQEYMPLVRETCGKLMEIPGCRDNAVQLMTIACEESELPEWLEKAAYSPQYTRRGNLIVRYNSCDDTPKAHLHERLLALERFSAFLDARCQDALGAEKKAEYHRNILTLLDSLRIDEKLPEGWILFYAYKSLVLAACLFGAGKTDEGWTAFETGIEMFETWYAFPDDKPLDLGGGELFGGLRIMKDWHRVVTPDGESETLFEHTGLAWYDAAWLYELLTNPRWAWFNSARPDPRFIRAAEWAKSLADAQAAAQTNK